jgi:hypothetical protein
VDGTVADLFGVNEAVAIPTPFLRQDRAIQDAILETRILATRELGVRHVRVHSAHFPFLNAWAREGGQFDEARADAFLARLLDAGLEPLVMIGPWPGNSTGSTTAEYVPADLDAYSAWVTRTVERYDGDGVNDAPGLPRGIRVWEVDNEPDLHHLRPPKNGAAPGFKVGRFESAAEYARVAVATVDAIHRADPESRILPAGLWAPWNETFSGYAEELWAMPEFRAAFSDVNAHGYPQRNLGDLWRGVDLLLRAAPTHSAWVTETSTPSIPPKSEREQATELACIYLEALRRGVERVYWHSLQEAPSMRAAPGGMQGHHLLLPREEERSVEATTRPRWKLAAWTMHEMIARYGGVPRASVTPIDAKGGHALQIGSDVVVFTVVPSAATVSVRLPPGRWERAALVPDEDHGLEVAGEPHWTTAVESVDGPLSVEVSAGPVRLTRMP